MESLSLRTDESIDEVVERYADMVYRLACAQTGRRDSADDVFQEFFCGLCDAIRPLPPKNTARHGCCA